MFSLMYPLNKLEMEPKLRENLFDEPLALGEHVFESARHEHSHCFPRLSLFIKIISLIEKYKFE